jgi:hypothetical protein
MFDRAIALGLVLLAVVWVTAATRADQPAPAHWSDYNRISTSRPTSRFEKRTVSVTPRDMLIEFWSKNTERQADAALLLTHDRFFAVRALQIEEGREVKPLTDALIDYVLILRLLERAIPEGPRGVPGNRTISFSEAAKSIEITIPGKRIIWSAPWRVQGRLAPDQQGRIAYQLKLFTAGDPPKELDGNIEFAPQLTSDFPSSLPLTGWKAFKIDRVQLVHVGQQSTEYWPHQLSNIATLGDLRAYAGRD